MGISFLYGLAVAASIGVLFTMIAALTLLPAMLGFIGPRVLSRRQRRALARRAERSRIRTTGSGRGGRGPSNGARSCTARVALVIICLLAVPFFSLRLGSSDQGNDPKGTTTRTAYDLLAKGFGPGFNGPLQIVAADDVAGAGRRLQRLATTVKGSARRGRGHPGDHDPRQGRHGRSR